MITVVIPVRNRAELVKRTLQSLADQTRMPEALVLVDNGSTDESFAVLQKWSESHPNTTVVSEPQPGAARARNAGLALVKTPYVLFFDSDDVMPPRHIEQICAALEASNMPQLAAFDIIYETIGGMRTYKKFRTGDRLFQQIFHSNLSTLRFAVQTKFIRNVGGWNESIEGWDDYELGVRMLTHNPSFAYINLNEPPVAYCQVESITGTDFSSKAGQWERALDACSEILRGTRYARLIDYRRAILAGEYRREGHAELAKGLVKGLRLKLIERYVAAGGRGVAYLARILR